MSLVWFSDLTFVSELAAPRVANAKSTTLVAGNTTESEPPA